jgi:hypothetical protein
MIQIFLAPLGCEFMSLYGALSLIMPPIICNVSYCIGAVVLRSCILYSGTRE